MVGPALVRAGTFRPLDQNLPTLYDQTEIIMRLINTTTFEFKEIDYPDDPDSPRYAILSHRWAREQFELKFHELEKPTEELKMLLPVLVRNDKNGAYNGSIGKAKVAWACPSGQGARVRLGLDRYVLYQG